MVNTVCAGSWALAAPGMSFWPGIQSWRNTVRLEVDMGDTPYQASDFYMAVARRDRMSDILTV